MLGSKLLPRADETKTVAETFWRLLRIGSTAQAAPVDELIGNSDADRHQTRGIPVRSSCNGRTSGQLFEAPFGSKECSDNAADRFHTGWYRSPVYP